MTRLVLLGRQGAGKGTQAGRLAERYGIPHISTGDLLRDAVRRGREFGRKAKEYMNRGELLPDDVMIGIVDERLAQPDAERGYILDGFPRTALQAEALDELTAQRPLDLVVDIDVPEDVVVERISSRRVCVDCGALYSTSAPPAVDWTCDVCGGRVVQRDDDTEDAVRRRLVLYRELTRPLLEFYAADGRLATVDGLGGAEEVFARIVAEIEARVST
ncbi:MAG: adenylate kinase [Acidimicrobiales bacterium]